MNQNEIIQRARDEVLAELSRRKQERRKEYNTNAATKSLFWGTNSRALAARFCISLER